MAVPHGEMAGKSWEKVEHEENLLEQLMEKSCTTWKTPWKHVEDTWKAPNHSPEKYGYIYGIPTPDWYRAAMTAVRKQSP